MLSRSTFAYHACSVTHDTTPVADNVFLIALPLNCVISPCQADNLRSHDADMLVVTTAMQYNGSFASHQILSIEIKLLPHGVVWFF